MRRAVLLLGLWVVAGSGVQAQDPGAAHADYLRAVAGFFNLPSNEVAILSDWEIPPEEIAVVLFVARRAGISPEALVALRDGGQSWSTLTDRYRVGPSALHVPVRDDAAAGALAGAYERFRSTPVGEWRSIRLSDRDIIALVNVRVISQSLGLPAERVIGQTSPAGSFVTLYAQLKR